MPTSDTVEVIVVNKWNMEAFGKALTVPRTPEDVSRVIKAISQVSFKSANMGTVLSAVIKTGVKITHHTTFEFSEAALRMMHENDRAYASIIVDFERMNFHLSSSITPQDKESVELIEKIRKSIDPDKDKREALERSEAAKKVAEASGKLQENTKSKGKSK